jgi:hypothetical protein
MKPATDGVAFSDSARKGGMDVGCGADCGMTESWTP